MATAFNTAKNETAIPKIVSREQWLAERKELLTQEKELTEQYDRVNASADRRNLYVKHHERNPNGTGTRRVWRCQPPVIVGRFVDELEVDRRLEVALNHCERDNACRGISPAATLATQAALDYITVSQGGHTFKEPENARYNDRAAYFTPFRVIPCCRCKRTLRFQRNEWAFVRCEPHRVLYRHTASSSTGHAR
jgi:Bacterial protein of unknown function (DUF899)